MNNNNLIGVLLILCFAMALTLLGLIFPDHRAGDEANNGFSASSGAAWTVKKAINYHQWIVEDSTKTEFIISVEGGFVPCFKAGTIIYLHRK